MLLGECITLNEEGGNRLQKKSIACKGVVYRVA